LAERAVVSAIIYEVERGSSWEQVAAYLGIGADEARERFAPALQEWHSAFQEPYRLDEAGRKRVPRLPTAAYDPAFACRQLDTWAFIHHIGVDDHQAVSAGIGMLTTVEEPDRTAKES
jgi:hypothetical protein